MYQHRSHWNKSLKRRKLWRSMYIKGNLRIRQLVKAGINPWRLMMIFDYLDDEEYYSYWIMAKT